MRYDIVIEPATTSKRSKAVHVTVRAIAPTNMIASATIQPENIGVFLSLVILPDVSV